LFRKAQNRLKHHTMKRIILLTCILAAAFAVNAQLDFGVKGGLNLTNIKTDTRAGDYQITSNPGSKLGYHAGGFMRVSLLGLYIQPELVFTSVATDYSVKDLNTSVNRIASQRIGRVDLPVLIGARLGTLRLGLGPVGSVIISDKSELKDITGYDAKLKSATFGYQVGVGLDVWKAGLDLRYEGNLSKLGDEIMVAGQPVKFDSRAKQVIFSLSFRF
jgi:hypothetical protein